MTPANVEQNPLEAAELTAVYDWALEQDPEHDAARTYMEMCLAISEAGALCGERSEAVYYLILARDAFAREYIMPRFLQGPLQ